MTVSRTPLARTAAVAAAVLLGAAGCETGGLETYPTTATVELPGGDVTVLAGSTVEGASEADPSVRIAGEVRPDGRVEFETLHAGRIVNGAPAGKYKARIILASDDKKVRRLAARAVSPRYMEFSSAGFTFQVPSPDAVVLRVTPPDARQLATLKADKD